MSNEFSVRPIGTRVSQWGEGPSYVDGRLVYVDIEGHALVSLDPETGEGRTWEMGERIGTVAPVESGGFLCAGDSGIYFLDPDTGERRIDELNARALGHAYPEKIVRSAFEKEIVQA